MTLDDEDNWSLTRALALLAAVFALVFGTVTPFSAMAASGNPLMVLCSDQGLEQGLAGKSDGAPKRDSGPRCAACVLPPQAILPQPPVPEPLSPPALSLTNLPVGRAETTPPPARAPPCPPSTAPPLA